MKLRGVLHPLLAALVLVVALSVETRLTAATPRSTATEPGPAAVRVLYPTAGAIVTSNPALIMILGPDTPESPAVQLDGALLPKERITFAEAWGAVPEKIPVPAGSDTLPLRSPLLADKDGKVLWAAAVELADGEHTVTLDGATLAVFSSRAPRETDARTLDEPVLRVHASPASRDEALECARCHPTDASGDSRVLGVAPTPESCHSCHLDVDLSLAHEHVMEFLAKCQMCHDPHAATRPTLLIDTREVVCGLCHESGYAR